MTQHDLPLNAFPVRISVTFLKRCNFISKVIKTQETTNKPYSLEKEESCVSVNYNMNIPFRIYWFNILKTALINITSDLFKKSS